MDSQMARPHGQSDEKEPHIVGHQMEGEDKMSVLKKVKAKAKKIKDTLTKHGHGHGHDHDRDLDDEEEEDDDDDVQEMVDDPEIHGAPIYDASVVKIAGRMEASGQVDTLPQERTVNRGDSNYGHHQKEEGMDHQPLAKSGWTSSVIDEVPKAPQNTPVSRISTATGTEDRHGRDDHDPTRTFVPGQEEHPGQPRVDLQRPGGGLVEDPAAPKDTPGAHPPSNYQSKVTDPSGRGSCGQEAGISPLLHSLDKMSIHGESKPKTGQEQNLPTGTEALYTSLPTGSHDQFSPELSPPKPVTEEISDSTTTQEHPHDNTGGGHEAAGDKSNSSMTESAIGYGKKIAVTVTEKIVGAGIGGGATGTGNEKEQGVGGQDKGVSVKDYFAQKLRPGEEDKALSEVISEVLHKKKTVPEKKSAPSRPVTEVISDAFHKRNEEPNEAAATDSRPMGKVTESEEVARRLGTSTEQEEDSSKEGTDSSFVNDSGNKGMVDKIKGAVGSWFSGRGGGGVETQGNQQQSLAAASEGSSPIEAAGLDATTTEERRLQESGN